MSAKDIFHESVRIAIEKDGWNITHDPLYLKVKDVEFYQRCSKEGSRHNL